MKCTALGLTVLQDDLLQQESDGIKITLQHILHT